MRKVSVFLLVFFLTTGYTDTPLSADAEGNYALDSTAGPFIVADEVIVKKGCAMLIGPGCVLLFKSFSGITVEGTLIVNGTREQPVILTSIRDVNNNYRAEDGPAAPFDWNGITISAKAEKVSLSNFLLSYSVFGIKSKNEKIRLDNGLFFSNGQFHFTIDDRIQPVKDNFPYSYNPGGTPAEQPP